jgi:biopolymer transport protein ExbB/TolQ
VVLSVIYYTIISQPMFADSLLVRYTTRHLVEYVVVTFFLWGLTDVVFHIARFPRELSALRAQWLGRSQGREPVSRVSSYLRWFQQLPASLQRSRMGRRYELALTELEAKGTTSDFDEYLRYLADMDYEQTQANYALLRFQCWVMPMFGFLGTVIHFGTALSGQNSTSLADNLPHVMAEMGTAFNTTTVALLAATTMMFFVFVCERIERGIVQGVDDRVNDELANRFQRTEAALEPFLDAVRQSNDECLAALREATHAHTTVWSQVLGEFESRFETLDLERHQRYTHLLETFERAQQGHVTAFEPAAQELVTCRVELQQLVRQLSQALEGRAELVQLQHQLSDNLRLLREAGSIDQALHGLTGAIHLLTARGANGREGRAA